jgi:BirA family transcriptional regulator, biotin operon repressor / biotin---[acetyl-CoA-carboxylase] ligase
VTGPLDQRNRQYALGEIESLHYFRSVRWVESIDSTNKALQCLVRDNGILFPALLISDRQTAGVGRGGNAWWSPSGCLMFSMAIPLAGGHDPLDRAKSSPIETRSALLPLRVGFTVADAIEGIVGRRVMVKWPNDVFLEGQKISGVLIEVVTPSDSSSKQAIAIVGVGINCQVDFTDAPTELKRSATSVHKWTGTRAIQSSAPENVLVEFVNRWIEQESRDVSNPNWLLEEWTKRDLLKGMWVEVLQTTTVAKGFCKGINSHGGLILEDENRHVSVVSAGTVTSFHSL